MWELFRGKEHAWLQGEGGMKGKDGRIVVNELDRGKLWKEHIEKNLNVKMNRIKWQKQIWLKDQFKK